MKKLMITLSVMVFAGLTGGAIAQEKPQQKPEVKAQSLDQLLEMVKKGSIAETAEHKRREAEFRAAKAQQLALLKKAKAEKLAQEKRSDRLETTFDKNEVRLAEYEKLLADRLGTLGELFGVVRQVSGDLRGIASGSIISAQFPDRIKFLGEFAQKKELPEISELRRLWYELQLEMTETGKVVKFPATVITTDGDQTETTVTRVGPFNAVANGKYLKFIAETGKLAELATQPPARFTDTVKKLEKAKDGMVAFGLDPTRGAILSLLIEVPTLNERVQQGGIIGYLTLALGAIGLLLATFQYFYLLNIGNKVRAQMKKDTVDESNPLGRVLAVYEANRGVDVETLELKLDEAILKSIPKLERGLTSIKVLSVIAPLLGLLGTVTGMIKTFQAITLFGTGDPKVMAGGISQALVTTVEGLVVAIPMTFLYTLVAGRSKSIIHVLEEQSAGIVAIHAEKHGV
jgi:biopolymer transport protein ExbB